MDFNTFAKTQIKLFIVLLILSLQSNSTQAQGYHHGYGVFIDFGIIDQVYTNIAGDQITNLEYPAIFGAMYKATYGFNEFFAVSSYPAIGLYGAFNANGGVGGFGFTLPVLAELYLGEMNAGCLTLGGGMSYTLIRSNLTGEGNFFGPQIGFGGQFKFQGRYLGVRMAYTHGLSGPVIADQVFERDKRRLYSFSIFHVIGS